MARNNRDNKKFWQRFAKFYAPFMKSSNSLYHDICFGIRPSLNKDAEILELACGSGQISHRIGNAVKRWEATDFSPNMIAEAEKKAHSEKIHFSVQDATDLPYPDKSFDVVVIANALHIMCAPDLAMKEIHRVLRDNGKLYAPTFIHGKGTGFRLRAKLLWIAGFRVYSKWNKKEFVKYVSDNGFHILKVEELGSSMAPVCYLEAEKQ